MTTTAHRRLVGSEQWAFVKEDDRAPPDFFEAEARSLRWLAETQTVLVPRVLSVDRTSIAVAAIEPGTPTEMGAERFGRQLAHLHLHEAGAFGAQWPGFIGPLPLENGTAMSWATFYVNYRVLPFLGQARDAGFIDRAGSEAIEAALTDLDQLPGATETARRIHGDLWSGNLVWDTDDHVWVIDPAAHGGHRETDLAMLALFGAPHLARIVTSYCEEAPLAPDWQARIGLHQLHPLLVHAVLFGSSYANQAVEVARHRRW
jgi:fructosamine-3-kinase